MAKKPSLRDQARGVVMRASMDPDQELVFVWGTIEYMTLTGITRQQRQQPCWFIILEWPPEDDSGDRMVFAFDRAVEIVRWAMMCWRQANPGLSDSLTKC